MSLTTMTYDVRRYSGGILRMGRRSSGAASRGLGGVGGLYFWGLGWGGKRERQDGRRIASAGIPQSGGTPRTHMTPRGHMRHLDLSRYPHLPPIS